MDSLHLIVHKSMIEDELLSDLTSSEKKIRLQAVLRRINGIEFKEYPHVKHVLFEMDNPDITQGLHHVVDVCQGYSSVMLYGISTTICLPFVERKLEEAGFKVTYDSYGTIE